ncbi:MAG: hypothetical protein NZ874_00650 [Fimbriimonadales bacterium]|nr:hypothetical protein [Fimbriimonadales bacterium]
MMSTFAAPALSRVRIGAYYTSRGFPVAPSSTVATYPQTETQTLPHTPDGGQQLIPQWRSLPLQQIVVERSGGMSGGWCRRCARQGCLGDRAPHRARAFARSLRPHLKTDAVDATLLARFAQVYEAPAAPAPCAAQATLKAPWGRREQVVRMLESERKRLATAGHLLVMASVARVIEQLEAELATLEAALAEAEASDAALAARGALVRSMVGMGRVGCAGVEVGCVGCCMWRRWWRCGVRGVGGGCTSGYWGVG